MYTELNPPYAAYKKRIMMTSHLSDQLPSWNSALAEAHIKQQAELSAETPSSKEAHPEIKGRVASVCFSIKSLFVTTAPSTQKELYSDSWLEEIDFTAKKIDRRDLPKDGAPLDVNKNGFIRNGLSKLVPVAEALSLGFFSLKSAALNSDENPSLANPFIDPPVLDDSSLDGVEMKNFGEEGDEEEGGRGSLLVNRFEARIQTCDYT